MAGGMWFRVNRDRPCPICGKPDWCLVSEDGTAAICPRIDEGSMRRCGEAGWLHRVTDRTGIPRRQFKTHIHAIRGPGPDLARHCKGYRQRLTGDQLQALSRDLGLSEASLERLGTGFDGQAYTFPMFDHRHQIVGIRRRFPDGRKRAVRGSHQGLFVPSDITDAEPLLVCEGPTDTAAGLDLGFRAVGRPSCQTGMDLLVQFFRGQDVMVIGDNDGPGRRGAELAACRLALHCPVVKVIIPPPGVKDLRDWLSCGASHESLVQEIESVKAVRLNLRTQIRGNTDVKRNRY